MSITVSYSASHSSSSPGRLLLNHISSPHVTLASAVAASCALPGIMLARPLEAKDRSGKVVKLDHDGVHGYVDGSLAADLPFKRIATLFNVSNFLVSQGENMCLSQPVNAWLLGHYDGVMVMLGWPCMALWLR